LCKAPQGEAGGGRAERQPAETALEEQRHEKDEELGDEQPSERKATVYGR